MNSIVQQFDAAATSYDQHSSVQNRIAIDLVERFADRLEPLDRIVEIGCGTGHLTSTLLRRLPNASLLATDASAAMIEQARLNVRGQNLQLETHVAENMPALVQRSDWVMSSMVFQWLDDWKRLAERLIDTSQGLAISLPVDGTFENWIAAHRDLGFQPGVRDFSGKQEIQRWLDSLPDCFQTELLTSEYQENFESPLDFVKSLRSIGANRPVKNHVPVNLNRVFAKFPNGISVCYSIAFIFLQRRA
jgi:malonyl-CoA O-methyltransferase